MSKKILYQYVYSSIRDKILTKKLDAGAYLIPERSLISEYGVSRVTIRKALRLLVIDGFIKNRPSVGYEVIDQAIKENIQKGLIGVILNDGYKPENLIMLRQLDEILKANNYSIILGFNMYKTDEEDKRIERFMALGLKGLIISPATIGSRKNLLNKLLVTDFPLVLLGQSMIWKISKQIQNRMHLVCEDIYKNVAHCLRHLNALGHENIIFVKPNDLKYTSLQEESYKILRGKGLITIIEIENSLNSRENLKTFKKIFSVKIKPSAIIAFDTITGFRVVQLLQKYGIAIPEEVSIISLGSMSNENLNQFPISNIEAFENDWAEKVFLSLEAQIKGKKVPNQLFVNQELVIRGSTAKAPHH